MMSITCPHCSRVGTLKTTVPPGTKVRCPGCQNRFEVQPGPEDDQVTELEEVGEPDATSTEMLNARRSSARRFAIIALIAGTFALGGIVATSVNLVGRRDRTRAEVASARPQTSPSPATQPVRKPNVAPAATRKVESLQEQQLRALLARVDALHVEDSERIAQIVVNVINALKEENQTATPAEVLEGSLRWVMPGTLTGGNQGKFAEYGGVYLMYRIKYHLNHVQAIRSLHYLASAVHLKSRQGLDEGFEAAFQSASPGCQLAMIESHELIREDEPQAEYYGLVNREVSEAYGLDEKEVGAATCFVISKLQRVGQHPHPDQVLRAASEWRSLPSKQTGRPQLLNFFQRYSQAREDGQKTHSQACVELLGKRPDDASLDL